MQKGIMLKKCPKNKAYAICFSFVSSFNTAGISLTGMLSYLFSSSPAGLSLGINISRHSLSFCRSSYSFLLLYNISFMSSSSVSLLLLFHPSVSSRERHTPRLRRVLSAPCGASNSGTDFFLAGFHPSTPSLPDALKVIATAYSFPRYGRGIVAAA